jgi:hypothetical protein
MRQVGWAEVRERVIKRTWINRKRAWMRSYDAGSSGIGSRRFRRMNLTFGGNGL